MLDTATDTIRQQLLGRIRPTSSYHAFFSKAVEQAFAIVDRFETERNIVLRDANFSDEGKRTAVATAVASKYAPELALGPAKVARHASERTASRRKVLGAPTFDRADLAGGLERREIRDFIRSQPDAKRVQVALEMAKDKKLAQAILSGPSPALTGLSSEHFAQVHTSYLKEHFGDQLADLVDEASDVEAVSAAVKIAYGKLAAASGMTAFQFEKDWTGLEQKADRA